MQFFLPAMMIRSTDQGVVHGHSHPLLVPDSLLRLDLLREPNEVIDEDRDARLEERNWRKYTGSRCQKARTVLSSNEESDSQTCQTIQLQTTRKKAWNKATS
jgi:hypothetical protein